MLSSSLSVLFNRGPPWLISSSIRLASVRRCVHFPSTMFATTSTLIIITITIAIIAIIATIAIIIEAMRHVAETRKRHLAITATMATEVAYMARSKRSKRSKQSKQSKRSRCFEARLWHLLQRAPPPKRKQLLGNFSEGQRLALERWALAQPAPPAPPALPALPAPPACASPARRTHNSEEQSTQAVDVANVRAETSAKVARIHSSLPRGHCVCSHRGREGAVRHDARVSCWPFRLFTKMSAHLPTVLSQLEVLLAVQRRFSQLDADCTDSFQDLGNHEMRKMKWKCFREAVAAEFEAREMNLTFDSGFRFEAYIPANFLLGKRLGTPHFAVSEGGLQKGYEAWQSLYYSLHSASGLEQGSLGSRRNRFTSIANTYGAEGLHETWVRFCACF